MVDFIDEVRTAYVYRAYKNNPARGEVVFDEWLEEYTRQTVVDALEEMADYWEAAGVPTVSGDTVVTYFRSRADAIERGGWIWVRCVIAITVRHLIIR